MDAKQDILAQLFQQKEILKNFLKILSAGYNLDNLLEHFISTLQELLKVGRIAILIQEDACFALKAYRGIPQDIATKILFPLKEGLINYLTVEGTALRLDSSKLIDPWAVNQLRAIGVTTAVPMWEHGRLKAVIVLNNKVVGVPISDEELELVFALGNQLAIAIENANLVDLISRQRNYLENILTNVSSAVISVDNNEIVTTYNTKAEDILGISSAEVIGKSVNSLPNDLSMLIKETIHSGVPIFRKELKISGMDKFVGVSITAIRDGQANSPGAVMIFTDLGPIKALEEQMRRSDRLDFTNTVAMRSSHELKNCLVSIKTFAQLLPERYSDKQFREDFYLVVNKEVDRLNQLVENLLFFAQPLKIDLSSVNVESLAQEAIEIIDKDEMLDGVVIKKEFRHHPPSLTFDRDSVKRVLKHLLYNSIQAMPKGGTIQIITDNASFQGKEFLEIKIIDDGIGIPEEIMEKVWDPFFTTKTRGIGLGLTIVRKIVEAHGGNVSAVSKSGVVGAEFIIRLPYVQEKKSSEKLYFPSGRAVIV